MKVGLLHRTKLIAHSAIQLNNDGIMIRAQSLHQANWNARCSLIWRGLGQLCDISPKQSIFSYVQ